MRQFCCTKCLKKNMGFVEACFVEALLKMCLRCQQALVEKSQIGSRALVLVTVSNADKNAWHESVCHVDVWHCRKFESPPKHVVRFCHHKRSVKRVSVLCEGAIRSKSRD